MKIRMICLSAAIACTAFVADARADARIDFRATEGGGAHIETLFIGQGLLRSDAGASTSLIMDPGTGVITLLQHDERTYVRMDQAEIERMGGAFASTMSQVDQTLAALPPSMRAQMQELTGGMLGVGDGRPMLQVRQTGQRETVAGHACTVYQTRKQGSLVSETCMAPASVLDGLSTAGRRTLDSAMAMTTQMAETLSKGPLRNLVDLGPFKGGLFPLRITEIDGSHRATSEFASITAVILPSDLFATPAGYREKKLEIPGLAR